MTLRRLLAIFWFMSALQGITFMLTGGWMNAMLYVFYGVAAAWFSFGQGRLLLK